MNFLEESIFIKQKRYDIKDMIINLPSYICLAIFQLWGRYFFCWTLNIISTYAYIVHDISIQKGHHGIFFHYRNYLPLFCSCTHLFYFHSELLFFLNTIKEAPNHISNCCVIFPLFSPLWLYFLLFIALYF